MKKSFILLLLFLCASFCGAAESEKPGLGMWVWPQTAFDTPAAREKLLAFCADERITHLDQHVGFGKGATGLSLQNADALGKLVVAARKQGITINALRGSADMFFERNHERMLHELREIVAYDKRLPAGARLSGVKYDVEPYGTVEWKAGGEKREKVMLDYLSFLVKAKLLLAKEAPHMELSMDVPFWWDKEELSVAFHGNEKPFIKHVQDLADYITIMSYRPDSKATLECVQLELAYAEEIGKSISPAIETGDMKGKESWISFHGKPPAVFRQTVSELQKTLSGNTAVRCIMIHHYDSLATYLGKTPGKPEAGDGL
ncbi:MAG: hypothetical protein ABJQ29_01745 [Luteolibacter sp.]